MEARHGFIRDKLDIKLLVLYILRRLPEPVSFDTLSDLALCDDAMNYFDYAECVAELKENNQLTEKDGLYSITPAGADNVDTIGSLLPYCIRMRVQKSTADLSAKLKRDSLITAEHSARVRGGYTVTLGMDDGLGPVINLNILAATIEDAQIIERNFKNKAESFYGKFMELLLEE